MSEARLPYEAIYSPPEETEPMDEYVRSINGRIQEAHEIARKTANGGQPNSEGVLRCKYKLQTLQAQRHCVSLRTPDSSRTHKLALPWSGPYKVTRTIGPDVLNFGSQKTKLCTEISPPQSPKRALH